MSNRNIPPNPWTCCRLCKFNKIVKTGLISSAITSFIIGIPLTVAGAIMISKANKTGEGKAGWIVMLVFGIIFLIAGVSTISTASTYSEASEWVEGVGCAPGQICCG